MSAPLMSPARSRVPRIAEAAVERARLTVVPRSRRHAPRVPFVTLVTLLLVGGVAGLLTFNTSMQSKAIETTAMEARAAQLDAQEQSLQMQLAALRDPQRVAVEAQALGMVPPTSPAFIRLSDGKVLGDPQPATSANGMRIRPLPIRKPADLDPATVVKMLPQSAASMAAAATALRGAAAKGRGHAHSGAAARSHGASAGTKAQTAHQH